MIFDGQLLSIHIANAASEAMQELAEARLIEGIGIEGDRYATGTGTYSDRPDVREVTLIDEETLIALQRDHDIELLPGEHRRNLTTRNVPLNHLVGRRFKVGATLLEGGRLNVPCKYLQTLLGKKCVCAAAKPIGIELPNYRGRGNLSGGPDSRGCKLTVQVGDSLLCKKKGSFDSIDFTLANLRSAIDIQGLLSGLVSQAGS